MKKNINKNIAVIVVALAVIVGGAVVAANATTTVGNNVSVGGTLGVTGNATFTTYASSTTSLNTQGTSHIGGNSVIEGTSTLTGALAANGGITVDTTNFTVSGTTGDIVTAGYASSTTSLNTQGTSHIGGNSVIEGTSTLTGALAANGGITVDTTNFTISGTTGDMVTAGYASSTTSLNTQGSFHAGGNAGIEGTLTMGTAATGLTFTGGYTTTAIQLGTSGTKLTLAAYDDHVIDINVTSASTDASNSVRPIHMIHTMTGVGGVGGRAEFELTTAVQLGGWANALKGYFKDMKEELREAAEHVLSVVDNGDRTINYDEAVEAVQILKPRLKSFLDEIKNIGSEYAKEENDSAVKTK